MHNFVFRQIGLKSPTGLKFQRGVPPIHKWILNILLNRLTVFARNVSPQSEQVQSTSVEKVQLWQIFSLLAISQLDQVPAEILKKRMERVNLVDGTELFSPQGAILFEFKLEPLIIRLQEEQLARFLYKSLRNYKSCWNCP